VHDELGQTITALKMELVCLEGDIKGNDLESLSSRARVMRTLIDSIFTSVQRIVTELRPQILDVLGLCDAMDWQAREYESRTGIHCHLKLQREEIKLVSELSTTFFRIFQETLTNVARHANATRIDISFQEANGHYVYNIKDNGKGMDENRVNTRKSIGLLGIRERVLSWGGETRIASAPGEGTSITVIIPRSHHVQNRQE
jgi:signal transduction histidine kinase